MNLNPNLNRLLANPNLRPNIATALAAAGTGIAAVALLPLGLVRVLIGIAVTVALVGGLRLAAAWVGIIDDNPTHTEDETRHDVP